MNLFLRKGCRWNYFAFLLFLFATDLFAGPRGSQDILLENRFDNEVCKPFKNYQGEKPTLLINTFTGIDTSNSMQLPDVGENISNTLYWLLSGCRDSVDVYKDNHQIENPTYLLEGKYSYREFIPKIDITPKLTHGDTKVELEVVSIFPGDIIRGAIKVWENVLQKIESIIIEKGRGSNFIVSISCLSWDEKNKNNFEMPSEVVVNKIKEGIKNALLEDAESLGIEAVTLNDGARHMKGSPLNCKGEGSSGDFPVELGGLFTVQGGKPVFSPTLYLKGFLGKEAYSLPFVEWQGNGQLPNKIDAFYGEIQNRVLSFSEHIFPYAKAEDIDIILKIEEALGEVLDESWGKSIELGIESFEKKELTKAEIFFEFALFGIVRETKGFDFLDPLKKVELGEVAYYKARIFQERKELDGAIALGESAIFLNEANLNAMELLASLYEGKGKYDDAIKMYERILVKDARNTRIRNSLGALYFKVNDFSKAEDQYRWVLSADPDSREAKEGLSGALMGLANQKFRGCNYSDSERNLREVIALQDPEMQDPEIRWAHLNLAELLLLNGKYHDALTLLQRDGQDISVSDPDHLKKLKEDIRRILVILAKALDGETLNLKEIEKMKEKSIPKKEWEFRYLYSRFNSLNWPNKTEKERILGSIALINEISPMDTWSDTEKLFFNKCNIGG